MKKIILYFVSLVVALSPLSAHDAAAQSSMQNLRTIEIGLLGTTHILFTSDLTYVDISMPRYISAKIVDASKNMLALKAKEKFDFVTTISALEANGTMHTFYVRFNENPASLLVDTRIADGEDSSAGTVNTQVRPETPAPGNGSVSVITDDTSNFGRSNAPTLEEVIRLPRSIYHVVDKKYRITSYVSNIYAYSDLIYIVIGIENGSDIGYNAGEAQLTIETKRESAKSLSSDKKLWIKSSYGTLSVAPRSSSFICYSVPKFTLEKNEVLKIYLYENGGTRHFVHILTSEDVNYAVPPV